MSSCTAEIASACCLVQDISETVRTPGTWQPRKKSVIITMLVHRYGQHYPIMKQPQSYSTASGAVWRDMTVYVYVMVCVTACTLLPSPGLGSIARHWQLDKLYCRQVLKAALLQRASCITSQHFCATIQTSLNYYNDSCRRILATREAMKEHKKFTPLNIFSTNTSTV